MRVEDWSEPWVWRPEEWPGQPLTLQVVGNRHLPRAIAAGNRFTPLYSFNGSSPGPTINGEFDLAANPEPPVPQKFGHHDPHHPRALVDTSEEWVLYNCSIPLWSHTDKAKFILMHEDHGQAVQVLPAAGDANYRPRTRVASHGMPAADVNAIYPAPSLELMYRQSLSFVDGNPELGQEFPGFPLEVPKLPSNA